MYGVSVEGVGKCVGVWRKVKENVGKCEKRHGEPQHFLP